MHPASALDTTLRTAAGWVILPVALVLHASAAIALAMLGAPAALVQRCYVSYARLCLRLAGIRLEIRGAERVAPGQAFVVVLNHESFLDPLCLVSALPQLALRFVVKQEIMKIPVLGHALRRTGNATVTRSDTPGDVARIREAMARRAAEVSLVFFAEGTRSRDGALHAFKRGAFATALAAELPVLPVAIAGTYALSPKGVLRLRRGRVAIEVGAPLSVKDLRFEDRERLRDQAHDAVSRLRSEARRRLRERGENPGGVN